MFHSFDTKHFRNSKHVLSLISFLFLISTTACTSSIHASGREKNVTIYYQHGFSESYIHFKQPSGNWTQVPGVKMEKAEFEGFNKITLPLENTNSLEACFNDGKENWDNNNKKNYTFLEGTHTFFNGSITAGKPQLSDAVLIYGDTRGIKNENHQGHEMVVNQIMNHQFKSAFHVGDAVDNGDNPLLWDSFKRISGKIMQQTNNRFYPTIGNHELMLDKNLGISTYFSVYPYLQQQKWYSVDINDIHYTVLYAPIEFKNDYYDEIKEGSPQYQWLVNDLSNVKPEIRNKVVVFHTPLFSSGPHGSSPWLSQILEPVFKKYGVSLVFNGHEHLYERSYKDGISYIITGAGGAPMADKVNQNPYSQKFVKQYEFCILQVINQRLCVKTYDKDNVLIDSVQINR